MNIRVSIIVPVYNMEQYLRRCLDSLAVQTLREMEFILVDDGSHDGSGAICDEYAQRDGRFVVVHKENEGVSAARNTGIALARGEYIGFADADDWVEADMFERMVECAQTSGADVAMCDAVTVYSDGRKESDTITRMPESGTLTRETMSPALLLELAGSVWRCIYSTKLIREHELRFPTGVKFSEDRIFNLYAMGRANQVFYKKEPYYNRYVNCESAVHRFHADYFEAYKKAAQGTRAAIAAAWKDDAAYQTAYLSQFISGALGAINNYFYRTSMLTRTERWNKVRELCEDEDLREAIRCTGFGGIRGKWILHKQVWLLCLCARILNWKYGR